MREKYKNLQDEYISDPALQGQIFAKQALELEAQELVNADI
jgi:hypothetical protein